MKKLSQRVVVKFPAFTLLETVKIPFHQPFYTDRYDRMVVGYKSDPDPNKPGRPLIGFENGKKAHDELWDGNVLNIPRVYFVTSSFFRGVAEQELKSCMTKREFRSRYVIKVIDDPILESLFDAYLDSYYIGKRR